MLQDGNPMALTGRRDGNDINITIGGLGSFIWRDRDDVVVRPGSPFGSGNFCGTCESSPKKRSASSSPKTPQGVKKRPSAKSIPDTSEDLTRRAKAALATSAGDRLRKALEATELGDHVDAFTVFFATITTKTMKVHEGFGPFRGKEFILFEFEVDKPYASHASTKKQFKDKIWSPFTANQLDCGPRGPSDPTVREGSKVLIGVYKYNNGAPDGPHFGIVHLDD
eukprot:TRINITY_DN42127_c0_g1_i1.p1 TRINITY_DN42127_c0_g1~~TRINITY_DN42127_c0_g1_i1.p1  ORF type:complete len:224 (-),score=42.52 TRINITY_DN42127_c0_g1_i1:149-820(-)